MSSRVWPFRCHFAEGAALGVGTARPPVTREVRSSAANTLEKHRINEMLCGLYFVTDQPAMAVHVVREMADVPVYPQMARRLDATVFWATRLADRTALETALHQLSQIATRWPNSFTTGLEQHALGLQAWLDGSLRDAETLLLSSCGAAFSVWTLFDLADLYLAQSKPAVAEDYFQRFEQHLGTMLSFWFTGTIVLGWLKRAVAAQARNDRAGALEFSKKVLDHWAETNPRLRIVHAAGNIHQASLALKERLFMYDFWSALGRRSSILMFTRLSKPPMTQALVF